MAKKENERSNLSILMDVKMEMERTTRKVTEALLETTNVGYDDIYPHPGFAAAKRAAMDLKKELTKLTQASRYKHSR